MAPCVLEVNAVQGAVKKDSLHGYLITFHQTGLHLWGSNSIQIPVLYTHWNESECTHSNGTACSNGQPLGSCMQINVEMSADLLQPLVKSLQLALLTLLELLALAAWGQARDVSLGSIY